MSKEERKQDIMRVAAEVFARRGYRPTTIDLLVEEAGISKGLFYIYFDSKKQAFIELVESYFEGFAAVLEDNHHHLEEAFARSAGGVEILETWRDNVANILQYHVDNPSLTFVVYQEALGSDEDFSERVNELSERASEMIMQEFKMTTDMGAMREIDLELVSAIAMGSIVNVIMDILLRKKRTDVDALSDMLIGYYARATALPGIDMDRLLKKVPKRHPAKKAGARAD